MMHAIALALALPTASGLGMIPMAHRRFSTCKGLVVLCAADAEAETKIREAAAWVVKAAEQFGERQGAEAAVWVAEAMSARSSTMDGSELLEKQMALFEECLIEDLEDSICTELDQALTALEQHLMVRSQGDGQIDRASARVCAAA